MIDTASQVPFGGAYATNHGLVHNYTDGDQVASGDGDRAYADGLTLQTRSPMRLERVVFSLCVIPVLATNFVIPPDPGGGLRRNGLLVCHTRFTVYGSPPGDIFYYFNGEADLRDTVIRPGDTLGIECNGIAVTTGGSTWNLAIVGTSGAPAVNGTGSFVVLLGSTLHQLTHS